MPASAWPAASMSAVYERLTAAGEAFETLPGADGRGRVYRHTPHSLREVFESSRRFGDREFIVFEDERLNYRDHARAVTRLAHVLVHDYGVRTGDRVGIAMRNWPEWSVCFWATVSIGAVAVAFNAWSAREELERLINHCAPRVLVLDEERSQRLGHPGAAQLGVAALLVARAAQPRSGMQALNALIGSVAEYHRLAEGELPPANVYADDGATLLYTSGTTGRARAVLATHRNILSNMLSRRFAQARAAVRRGDAPSPFASGATRLLAPVPLFHVTGCHSYLVPTLAGGDTMVLMHHWRAERALELIQREQLTTVGGVPTMMVQLLQCEGFDAERMNSVRTLVCGGSASGHSLVERIHNALPNVITGNGYGMTETCSLISQNTAEDHLARPDSVGPLVPVCDGRVVNASGDEVPVDEVGELWVRGANVVTEYWHDDGTGADRFVDGWLRTGDLVRRDGEGFLYVVDRLKDLVIRGGENVACAEVENVLLRHPRVVESAVFGLPHPELGETVAAWVQISPGTPVHTSDLAATVAGALAAFKVPSKIWLQREPLPRNAAGKVLKQQLRECAIAQLAGTTGDKRHG